jgi:hypothetical protein
MQISTINSWTNLSFKWRLKNDWFFKLFSRKAINWHLNADDAKNISKYSPKLYNFVDSFKNKLFNSNEINNNYWYLLNEDQNIDNYKTTRIISNIYYDTNINNNRYQQDEFKISNIGINNHIDLIFTDAEKLQGFKGYYYATSALRVMKTPYRMEAHYSNDDIRKFQELKLDTKKKALVKEFLDEIYKTQHLLQNANDSQNIYHYQIIKNILTERIKIIKGLKANLEKKFTSDELKLVNDLKEINFAISLKLEARSNFIVIWFRYLLTCCKNILKAIGLFFKAISNYFTHKIQRNSYIRRKVIKSLIQKIINKEANSLLLTLYGIIPIAKENLNFESLMQDEKKIDSSLRDELYERYHSQYNTNEGWNAIIRRNFNKAYYVIADCLFFIFEFISLIPKILKNLLTGKSLMDNIDHQVSDKIENASQKKVSDAQDLQKKSSNCNNQPNNLTQSFQELEKSRMENNNVAEGTTIMDLQKNTQGLANYYLFNRDNNLKSQAFFII